MTPELRKRLLGSLPPFDGVCWHTADEISLFQLREILSTVIEELSKSFAEIWLFRDWHEHDGFVTQSTGFSWESCRQVLQSPQKLYESRDDDFGVRVAIHSTELDWLLRYNIDSEDENEIDTALCDFDLTISRPLTESIQEFFHPYNDLLNSSPSKDWFDARAGS